MKHKDDDLHELEEFFAEYPAYTAAGGSSAADEKLIRDAWNWLNELCEKGIPETRPNGERYTDHPLRTAAIIAHNKMDAESVVSALLHNVLVFESVTLDDVEKKFGKSVANIISRTSRIGTLKFQNKTLQQADSFRKMLFAMTDDIRVILVKLADRLDRLRFLKHETEENQKYIAQETLDVWAPLANRLGMSGLKDELEDLSLKYTNPDAYLQIKQMVSLKKDERAVYLTNAQNAILKAAAKQNIDIEISSRAKHFYSIYQKMKKRGKAADEIYDLLALRILCDDVNQCYTLIGLVHRLWLPLDGRFKDYIAMPKANGYQSLHTTVMCDGKPLEIQIRTHDMHHLAEHGVASHWLYKKGTNHDAVSIDNLSIINQLKALRKDGGNDDELFREIRDELLGDSIFVFTPKGDVRELPVGSTAVDFAYSIHTHIGETIVGAKADGHIIPLSSPLKNTQIIDILTNPQAHPTENQLQYVKTSKARSKIKAYLLANADANSSFAGQTPTPASSGTGTHSAQNSSTGSSANQVDAEQALSQEEQRKTASQSEPLRIRVGDTANFMVHSARCCYPIYGDSIVGYVSRGRGLIIHRSDCPSFLRIPNVKERSVAVVWDAKPVEFTGSGKKKKR